MTDIVENEPPEAQPAAAVQSQLATIAGQLQHIADQLSGAVEAHSAVQIQANLQTEIARITALSAGQKPAPLAEPGQNWPPPPDPTLAKFNQELADLADNTKKLQTLAAQIETMVSLLGNYTSSLLQALRQAGGA